jgi:acetyltransferase-like isoleucine patch superfamily enzyme
MHYVDPSAEIGEGCAIGYGVVIESGVRLGPGCRIDHHAVLYTGTELGAGCRVGASAVLGKAPEPAPTSVNRSPADLPPLRLGAGCIVGAQAVIYRGTVIGQKCLIADQSFVRENTRIADYVIVGAHATIENRVTIGAYTKIQTGAYITAATTLEDHVFIAPGVVTTNDNYMGRTEERFKHWGGPIVRRGARVGADVTLLPNVEVGEEAFVAAGSIVTRDVPAKSMVLGSPAKAKRSVPEAEWVDNGENKFQEPNSKNQIPEKSAGSLNLILGS